MILDSTWNKHAFITVMLLCHILLRVYLMNMSLACWKLKVLICSLGYCLQSPSGLWVAHVRLDLLTLVFTGSIPHNSKLLPVPRNIMVLIGSVFLLHMQLSLAVWPPFSSPILKWLFLQDTTQWSLPWLSRHKRSAPSSVTQYFCCIFAHSTAVCQFSISGATQGSPWGSRLCLTQFKSSVSRTM